MVEIALNFDDYRVATQTSDASRRLIKCPLLSESRQFPEYPRAFNPHIDFTVERPEIANPLAADNSSAVPKQTGQ